MPTLTAVTVAKICHQANKAYCESIGDTTQNDWERAPEWQRKSCINGVIFHWNTIGSKPGDSHVNWMKEKVRDGWTYGAHKDEDKKQHPCMVPFDQLPQDQQTKDIIFTAICKGLKPYAGMSFP